MKESADIPGRESVPAGKPRRWRAVLVVGLVLAGCTLWLGSYATVADRSPRTWNQVAAMQIRFDCKMYAEDHGGLFPESLAAMIPDYLPGPELLQPSEKRGGKSVKSGREFFYIPGLRTDAPGDLILLAGPPESRGDRLVMTHGGWCDYVSAEVCREKLKLYREWIRKEGSRL